MLRFGFDRDARAAAHGFAGDFEQRFKQPIDARLPNQIVALAQIQVFDDIGASGGFGFGAGFAELLRPNLFEFVHQL